MQCIFCVQARVPFGAALQSALAHLPQAHVRFRAICTYTY